MSSLTVQDHRRYAIQEPPPYIRLPHPRTTLFRRFTLCMSLCLVLVLFPFFVSAEPLYERSPVLDEQLAIGIYPTNSTWEAGKYAVIDVHVHLGSEDTSPPRATRSSLPDAIDMRLVSFHSRSNVILSADSSLVLIGQEHCEDGLILRYRWPVPPCLPSGRHTLRTEVSLPGHRRQLLNTPISVVVPDAIRPVTCSSQNIHRAQQSQQRYLVKRAFPGPTSSSVEPDVGSIPATIIPSTLPLTVVFPSSSAYSTSSSFAGNYTVPTSTSYASYGFGTGSASNVSTSVEVVTTTATSISVQTSISVTTDVETVLTTVTGPDATKVLTTTMTLISTAMVMITTTSTGDFLPVNAAIHPVMIPTSVLLTICLSTMLWTLCS